MRVYKNNKYNNKNAKTLKLLKKRVLVLSGIGLIALCGINIVKINAEEQKNKINIVVTEDDSKKLVVKTGNDNDDTYNPFKVGSGGVREVNEFLYGPMGKYIYEYAEMYGVDPNLMCAIAMQESSLNHKECIPGGSMYSGYGVGLMQLESPSGQEISAYNYKTGEVDTEYITMTNACDPVKNIKIGCMIFQNSLNYNKGNALLAIQSYNYGQGMVDLVLEEAYVNSSDIKNEYENIKWVDFMKDAHNNPSKYILGWKESKYGDGNYLANVLRFCPNSKIKYNYDGKKICFDLKETKIESELFLEQQATK